MNTSRLLFNKYIMTNQMIELKVHAFNEVKTEVLKLYSIIFADYVLKKLTNVNLIFFMKLRGILRR